jgi:hypothetical protein
MRSSSLRRTPLAPLGTVAGLALALSACADPVSPTAGVGPSFATGSHPIPVGSTEIDVSSGSSWSYCGYANTFTPDVGTVFSGGCVPASDLSTALDAYNPGWPRESLGWTAIWMGPQDDANEYTVAPGTYTFVKQFTLPANATEQVLNLAIKADNVAIVYLNGVEVGRHSPTFDNPANWNTTLLLHDITNFSTDNTLRVDLIDTRIGVGHNNIPSGFPDKCHLGPQKTGTNAAGQTVPTPQSLANGWDVEDCLNPAAVSFEGTVGYIPVVLGEQGCSHGFWKNRGVRIGAWGAAGFTTGTSLADAGFGPSDYGSTSMLDALKFDGGSGVLGAQRILLRNAVAALLNASSPDVDYPLTAAQVVAQVNAALATGDRDAMLALEGTLDDYNNLHGASICTD